jgi:poly-gamma-glutamate synthesis protein (capsule biosynthesis protein)
MRGEPRILEALPKAGFKVVNVANNHSLQHGVDTFSDTVAMLERSGLGCCGVAADREATRSKPLIVQQNGLTIGFLGYSLRPRQYFDHLPLYAEGHPESMVLDVVELRCKTDVVIVSVHWGEEFIQEPAPREIKLARQLVDAGATLIIGHHPHVLRGIEHHGTGCIVYSLGNFVCDMVWDETLRTSMIFECELSPAGVRNVRLTPVFINDDYQPTPLPEALAARVRQNLQSMSERHFVAQAADSTEMDAAYAERAEVVLRHIRAKSHRFFLSQFWRYPSRMLIQQLATYARNRAHERIIAPQRADASTVSRPKV